MREKGTVTLRLYLVEHYGDIASVVGLVTTIVGFAVTIHGVRKARRVAEEALSRIKGQLLSDNVAGMLRTFRQLDSACRSARWEEAQDRCDDARVVLAQLGANPRLGEDESTLVHSTLTDLGDLLAQIHKNRRLSSQKPIPQRLSRRLHEVITMLGKFHERLRSDTLEV
jgi:hypothetical protein